jgi:hypothetical protein
MLIEGLHIYRIIVHVFKLEMKLRYTLMFGYGIPLVIIGYSYLIIYFIEDITLFDNMTPDEYYL